MLDNISPNIQSVLKMKSTRYKSDSSLGWAAVKYLKSLAKSVYILAKNIFDQLVTVVFHGSRTQRLLSNVVVEKNVLGECCHTSVP